MEQLLELIKKAHSIILSTHRQCDGDGLGAELAMYFALQKIGKKVKVINLDPTPRKYRFLNPEAHITYFDDTPSVDTKADLVLIFDTNDERLIQPLYKQFKDNAQNIAFIDHHPVLKQGPQPTPESVIDISAASTGEMAYEIIKKLNIPLDANIALALYTSITFDTQLYRYIRNSPKSHLIAAELIGFSINPSEVHRYLFGGQTVNKMAFLGHALNQVEYFCDGRLALLKLHDKDLTKFEMEADDSRDVIDMLMNIETLEAAAIFREDDTNEYKLSFRSKGKIEVLSIAESLGGGGHIYASGAFVKDNYTNIKEKVLQDLKRKIQQATR